MLEVKQKILDATDRAVGRLSPNALVRQLATSGWRPLSIRKAITELVAAGTLAYAYEFGQSYLGRSFTRPVTVSNRIVIAPPSHADVRVPGCHTIVLASGAAFGNGSHATTRLAIRALDFAFHTIHPQSSDGEISALDVGTGSGVLAIAAALLGADRVTAVDIDTCAVKEARDNVALNNLEDSIRVRGGEADHAAESYDVLMANLRLPTIQAMYPLASRCLNCAGVAIISGIKDNEMARVMVTYGREFSCEWQAVEKGWGGIVLKKNGGRRSGSATMLPLKEGLSPDGVDND